MQYVLHSTGVAIGLSIALCACARHPQVVPLPPLDMPREAAASGQGESYRIQSGDVLRVKFLYHPELDVKVPIRPDGVVTLQIAGDIHAAGLTTTELQEIIKQRSSDRLRDPEISVIVAQLGDQKVYVGGEVRVPGFVPYRIGMTPLQAIMDRGGFTDIARSDSVLRLCMAQNDYQGTRLNLDKPLSDGTADGTQLSPGDVLFVPRTFIGDVDSFVKRYVQDVLPIPPRVGFGTVF